MDATPPPARFSLEPVDSEDSEDLRLLICAACCRKTDTVPCSLCGRNPLLEGRYRLESIIPGDAVGLTYAASDLRRAGRSVRVRIVPLRSEAIDTVRAAYPRWLEALRTVHHPTLRTWLDAFLVGAGRSRALGIVQLPSELPTLASLPGGPWSVARTRECVEHLLEGLVLLHSAQVPLSGGPLTRPRLGVSADGLPLVLHPVDVEAYGDRPEASVWTPPEVLNGTWSPASDVFRVGALAVSLLSGRTLSQLTTARGERDWQRHVHGDARLHRMLERWLSTDPSDRPANAWAALEELRALHRTRAAVDESPTLDIPVQDVPVGVAAVRVPMAIDPPAARSAVAHPARRAQHARRRLVASAGSSADTPPTVRSTDPVRWVLLAVTAIVLVVSLLSAQIALTSMGWLPGSPLISMRQRSTAAP